MNARKWAVVEFTLIAAMMLFVTLISIFSGN